MSADGLMPMAARYNSPHRPVLLEIIRAGLATDEEMMAVLAIACSRNDAPLLDAIRSGLVGRTDLHLAAQDFLAMIGKPGLL